MTEPQPSPSRGRGSADFAGTRQTRDDGAYEHLTVGLEVPRIRLPATTGERLDVVAAAPITVAFLYPATGVPGQPLPDGWTEIPGAYGCTAESCRFRDLSAEFAAAGAALRGISTQTPQEQAEFAAREGIDYPLLSDHGLGLVDALRLPTFAVGRQPPRIRRATLIIGADRRLRAVLYPVADPAGHADHVLDLMAHLGP
jgi:peroxiredoxin